MRSGLSLTTLKRKWGVPPLWPNHFFASIGHGRHCGGVKVPVCPCCGHAERKYGPFCPQMWRSFHCTNTFNIFACLDHFSDGVLQRHVSQTSDIHYQKMGGFFQKKGWGGSFVPTIMWNLVWHNNQANERGGGLQNTPRHLSAKKGPPPALDTHTHTNKRLQTNEHNAAQNVRFLVSWIVKQETCSTPIGAFLQYRTQCATS